MRRHRVLHFEPHDFAEPPLEHLLLHHFEQVFGFVGRREIEVRVAGHSERVPPHDLHAGEERAQVRADQLLQRHELVGAAERHPAREALRNFDAREMLDAFDRVANLDGE